MAVPSSGQLRLRADIALEVDGSATGDNVSLGTLADSADFTNPPDQMSEFYGYVSYEQPTVSGTPTTLNVYDVSMRVDSPTFSNPSGGSVERGFYFGTSTTMTNNTWYSEGNTSSTSFDFTRNFTGLSASTTYYAWAGIRDTESPARFTATYSSMKTQGTGAAYTYTIYGGATQGCYCELFPPNTNVYSTVYNQYNHFYYGWTTLDQVEKYFSVGSSGSNQSGWAPVGQWKAGYLSGGTATENRTIGYLRLRDNNTPYPSYLGQYMEAKAEFRSGTSSISGSSYFNGGATGTVVTQDSGGSNARYGWASNVNYNTNSMRVSSGGGSAQIVYEIKMEYDV
jgi:hypothetical protein